jgi:stage II sporulation protein AA (anti-sigma F factor antagonist)
MDRLDAERGPQMTFDIAERDKTAVVTISGELDISNVARLDAAVTPVISRDVNHLVLEVGDLMFADSSAIAVWVRWATTVGDLRLNEVSPLLRTVIETMGLDSRLKLE